MQAITQSTYGSPDALTLTEVDAPALTPYGMLVEVFATPVTQGDRRLRTGDFPGITWLPGRLAMGLTGPRTPIPGTMFAGRIIAVGARVTRWSVGDDVFGSVDHGAMAELLVIEESGTLAALPEGLSHAEAAALPYGAGTALTFLQDMAEVKPGEHVCILGASGGVGRYAVQVAKHLGAEVTAVCSARHHPWVRALGADHLIDHATRDFRDGDPRYDVVLDTADAADFASVRAALAPQGRFLTLFMGVRILLDMLRTAWGSGPRALTGVALGSAEQLEAIRVLAEAGALTPRVAHTVSLAQAAEAHAIVERGEVRGEVMVTVGAPRRDTRAA